MTVYAGIYLKNSKLQVNKELRVTLKKSISRSPENIVTEYEWPGVYLLQAEIDAFGHPDCVRLHDGGAVIIAGQLLIDPTLIQNRLPEMERLGSSFSDSDGTEKKQLQNARGTFSLCGYFPAGHRLLLAVDRLGVRPLYYYEDEGKILFATALRIFESMGKHIRLNLDLQALIELNVFGFPLGIRTPYEGIHCMRGGETIFWKNGIKREEVYWRWDQIPDSQDAEVRSASNLYRVFMDAVKIRIGNDRIAQALLSGGLDSRCVVTALKLLGLEIHSYNMSKQQTLDEILGAEYAQYIKSNHHQIRLADDLSGSAWPQLISSALKERPTVPFEGGGGRTRVIWSGDGGSVGMGRVYMNKETVQVLRNGDIVGGIRQFLEYNNIKFFRGAFHAKLKREQEKLLFMELENEFSRFECNDPGKALFLFLLQNDQRRHMADFYEDIDVNRVEYQLPFFDGEFLAAATALPLDITLNHRYYVDYWLHAFGGTVLEVPWQAYPGHKASLKPLPENASYQWRKNREQFGFKLRMKQMYQAFKWAGNKDLPGCFFSRSRLFAIGMSAAIFGKNYSYVIKSVENIARYKIKGNIFEYKGD